MINSLASATATSMFNKVGSTIPSKATAANATVPMFQSQMLTMGTREFRSYDITKETVAEYKQAKASFNYNNYMKSGKLEYDSGIKLLGLTLKDAQYKYNPDKGDTFGKVQSALSLPEGTFNGTSDLQTVDNPISIKADILDKAIGKE